MAFRKLDNIDEKIIQATIRIAGKHEANHFSTKQVADELGISEYVIYAHFKTKDNLLNACDARIASEFYAEVRHLVPLYTNFYDFFSALLDFELKGGERNAFAINYCRVFPRYEKASDFASFRSALQELLQELLPYFPLGKSTDPFATWCFFVREFVCDAQLLIDRHIKDTPENRHFMAQCLYEGFAPLLLN